MQETIFDVRSFIAREPGEALHTKAIQKAIDAAAAVQGTVVFSPSEYTCGTIFLRSNITLELQEGAVLLGSRDISDYGNRGWRNALLIGDGIEHITITGKGVIDGQDCRDPNGEEGFRGAHTLYFSKSTNITISGITIQNSGNYATLHEDCRQCTIRELTVTGGHDGIHLQRCQDYTVEKCALYTGDDSVAGSDNRNMLFTDCINNSSCNGFRFGGSDITVRKCHIFGPGKYRHQISGRTNMESAFTYFSPKDRDCTVVGENWLIEDVTVEGANGFYSYDYETGIWQDGKPLKSIRMRNIRATGLILPLELMGDRNKQLSVELENVSLSFISQFHIQDVLKVSKIGSLQVSGLSITCDE